jgi:DNA helicase TIP49 (TBP-interacting protein)
VTKPNKKTPKPADHRYANRNKTNLHFQELRRKNFGLTQREVRRILEGKTKSMHIQLTNHQISQLILETRKDFK